MNLHILNDLHIEFEDLELPATDADVVVLMSNKVLYEMLFDRNKKNVALFDSNECFSINTSDR